MTGFGRMLEAARRRGAAVAGFVVQDAESAGAVLRAAAGRPVVLLVPGHLATLPAGEILLSGLRSVIERSGAPAWVQLDHAHAVEEIAAACELGVSAVMADGSHLDHAANREFVLAARGVAARHGVAVEAQLAPLAGDEDVARQAEPGAVTDPGEAAAFVRATGVDCLGVAVGNVHGHYRRTPRLDLARVGRLAAGVPVPLALHGGSGLPVEAVRAAVRAGITKVNVATALRSAYLEATASGVGTGNLRALHRAQAGAVEAAAAQLIDGLSAEQHNLLSRP